MYQNCAVCGSLMAAAVHGHFHVLQTVLCVFLPRNTAPLCHKQSLPPCSNETELVLLNRKSHAGKESSPQHLVKTEQQSTIETSENPGDPRRYNRGSWDTGPAVVPTNCTNHSSYGFWAMPFLQQDKYHGGQLSVWHPAISDWYWTVDYIHILIRIGATVVSFYRYPTNRKTMENNIQLW